MMDAFMGHSIIPVAPVNGAVERKRTSGGVSVVDTGNASQRLVSPAGTSRGLSLNPTDFIDDAFTGRVSLTMLGVGVLALVAFYIWTRDVQGGG